MSQTNLSGNSTGFTGIQTAAINPTAGTIITGKIQLFHAQQGTSGKNGDQAPSALRPGDVTLTLTNSGIANATAFSVQSCSISLPLARESIQKLGSRFAVVKVMTFPILATINVSATLTDIDSRNLADQIDSNATQDLIVTVKNGTNRTSMVYTLKKCKLDSESFSSSIGSNKSVDLTFSTQIGGANDSTNGVFVSGESNIPAFITGSSRSGTDYAGY